MKYIVACISIYLYLSQAVFAQSIGFQKFNIGDNTQRQLNVTLWYPTLSSKVATKVAENIAFYGTEVVENASFPATKMPLVLLSHGYRGSWRNLNWLAHRLVKQGMLVIAVDHPGTTTFNINPAQANKWWLRPNDLVRALDFLLENKQWRAVIDDKRISAIGHSLGGWSVMQLVGAQFDREQFFAQCKLNPNPRTYGLANELGLNKKQPEEPINTNFIDERINRVVVLDLGLARSLSVQSLNNITKPVLILGAGIDIGDLPQAQESGFLAEHIPLLNRRYQVYESAMHFSFMQLCKPMAYDLLEDESKGDGIICKDGFGTTRRLLHQKMFTDISDFLAH